MFCSKVYITVTRLVVGTRDYHKKDVTLKKRYVQVVHQWQRLELNFLMLQYQWYGLRWIMTRLVVGTQDYHKKDVILRGR